MEAELTAFLTPAALSTLTQSLCLWHWTANIEAIWLQQYSELLPNTALFTTANECTQATEAHVPTYDGTWHLVKKSWQRPSCHKADDEAHPRFAVQAADFQRETY